ncbi:MAG: 23S rRNA (guanosine(2251)-2'-O)-methyltransferase RlmB [Flavobacteriaceae bacterium]|nr:23S rRNA (guanosine(2251)-2'-O)-methyltransferase RlmB [Flavobacteriaceae bacterium]
MQTTTKIFGIRAVIEAIKSDKSIDKVFLQNGINNELFSELEQLLRKKSIKASYVPIEKLNRLTDKNHQGVVASVSPVEFYEIEEIIEKVEKVGRKSTYLLLDQISDVRNFGAIIRSAECSGVDAIIIQKKSSAPINGDTIKTSAGAVFNIPICKVDHIKDAVFHLQASGINIVAATEKTNDTVYSVNFKDSCAIIMGAEGKGISPSVLKLADQKAKLPMFGKIESLNVSVACGIFLYELIRQRL